MLQEGELRRQWFESLQGQGRALSTVLDNGELHHRAGKEAAILREQREAERVGRTAHRSHGRTCRGL